MEIPKPTFLEVLNGKSPGFLGGQNPPKNGILDFSCFPGHIRCDDHLLGIGQKFLHFWSPFRPRTFSNELTDDEFGNEEKVQTASQKKGPAHSHFLCAY